MVRLVLKTSGTTGLDNRYCAAGFLQQWRARCSETNPVHAIYAYEQRFAVETGTLRLGFIAAVKLKSWGKETSFLTDPFEAQSE